MDCLAEEELLVASRAGGLGGQPSLEAHLAECSSCSEVIASLVIASRDLEHAPWGSRVGQRLGSRYRLDAQVGEGAMGVVYRGWDETLDRCVAVKVLKPESLTPNSVDSEARLAAGIVHPNVVATYDVGRQDETHFVVSEFVEGESIRSVIGRGPLPESEVYRLASELAQGVAAAHHVGVIHRDLKPENLVSTREGTLKILDFGLAVFTDPATAETNGATIGTPGYMAPEQARGEPIDGRVDIFAIGAIVYELSTGAPAFAGTTRAERLSALMNDEPAKLDRETLGLLTPLIQRCLAKDPRDRFRSARDLAWSLEQLSNGRSSAPVVDEPAEVRHRPSRRQLLLGGVAATGVGVLGYMAGRRQGAEQESTLTPTVRQLTFRRGRLMTARFARDGSSVYFGADWVGDQLTAHRLRFEGGIVRTLSANADVLAVSRTDLVLSIGRRNVIGQSALGKLAIMAIDGSSPRPIRENVQDADSTVDGELAIIDRVEDKFRLEWPIGTERVVSGQWLSTPRISPDGKRLAFLVHPEPNDDRGHVATIERNGDSIRKISTDFASIAGLAWDTDSLQPLVSASIGAEGSALWRLDDGQHRKVFDLPGRLRLHDLDAAGRALVSLDKWRLRTMVKKGSGSDVDRSLTSVSMVADISADGTSLVVGEMGDIDSVNGVYIVQSESGKRIRLGAGFPLARTPDGSRVLAVMMEPTGEGRGNAVIYRSEAGPGRPVSIDPVQELFWAEWIDSNRFVAGGTAVGGRHRIWIIDSKGTPAQPLGASDVYGRGILSGDRSKLAVVDQGGRLQLLGIDGHSQQLGGSFVETVACGWDGDAPLVRTQTAPIEIRRIDPTTGEQTLLRHITPPALGAKGVDAVVLASNVIHAYSYGQELSELLLVELG